MPTLPLVAMSRVSLALGLWRARHVQRDHDAWTSSCVREIRRRRIAEFPPGGRCPSGANASEEEPDMDDLGTMANAVGALLKEKKQTIAVAESSAGGLISAALLAVPGASAYFLGGG